MTSLLSSISGQFGKVVILGTLFPVLLVSILNELFVAPILPFGAILQDQLRKIATGEDKWAAVSLVFVVIVVTGILYNLNIPIIRIYEGYPWKQSYLGALFLRSKKKRFREAVPLRLALRYLRRDLLDSDSGLAAILQTQQNALALFINGELPDSEDNVLPTRLGNVIRCFERYSSVAYGMDAIVLWPRLVSKIESGFASTIDEAKASLDFMINSSFLCAATVVIIVIAGLSDRTSLSIGSVMPYLWRSVLFLALSSIFYVFAIGRAKAWGAQVKSAFDLYRFDLLKALGYQQQPLTFFEEKALWRRISLQLLYADSRETPIPYKSGPTRVTASPVGIRLEVTRALKPTAVSGNVAVEITLENKDRSPTEFVIISEVVPDGFRLLSNSVQSSIGSLIVSNLAPFEMKLDKIDPKDKVVVTYILKPTAA